jgi:predicted nucleotidyltransferase
MKRDEAISRLLRHEGDLKRLGVTHLCIFGSTARGEASENSDVDLFFDHEKSKLGSHLQNCSGAMNFPPG